MTAMEIIGSSTIELSSISVQHIQISRKILSKRTALRERYVVLIRMHDACAVRTDAGSLHKLKLFSGGLRIQSVLSV